MARVRHALYASVHFFIMRDVKCCVRVRVFGWRCMVLLYCPASYSCFILSGLLLLIHCYYYSRNIFNAYTVRAHFWLQITVLAIQKHISIF